MALAIKPNRTAPTEELKDSPESVEAVEQATEQKAQVQETKADTVAETEAPAETAAEEVANDEQAEPAAAAQEVETKQAPAKTVQTSSATQVQVAGTAGSVAPSKQSGQGANSYFAQMIRELEESGQEGLEMGFGVFPMISLDKGEFKVGDEDIGRDDFQGVPLSSKPKFCYRTTGVPDKEAEVIYCDSNKEHLDHNSAVSAKLMEWKQKWQDSGWEVKQYQDVYMYLTDFPAKPEMVGQLVQLSVAPTSVKRYTQACLTAKSKGREAHDCVFKVSVGEKIRGEFDYYPWDFKAIGSCQRLGVVVKFGSEVDEDF